MKQTNQTTNGAPVQPATPETETRRATVAEKIAEILRPFEEPRALLKEWTKAETGAEFDALQELAAADLAHFFGDAFKFTSGSRPRFYDDFKKYEVSELFGLPYTSSSSFAAVWNTNTEARTREPLPALFFKGIAIQPRPAAKYKKFDFIYIFLTDTDAGETLLYFTAEEFIQTQKRLKDLHRAATLAEFVQSINKITPAAVDILRSYNGKKAGEKTRDKLRGELLTLAEAIAPRVSIWADFSQYSPALRFSYGYNTFEKIVYIKFYDATTNTIHTPEEIPAPLKEFDAVALLDEMKSKGEAAQNAAAVLLPLIDEYNDAARLLQLPTIPHTAADVFALAKYGATYAAKN